MELDIRTLTFALSFTFIIQAIALYVMSMVITNYNGVREWALGSISVAIGFAFIYMRNIEGFEKISIILTNFFHYLGFLLFYVGSTKFLSLSRVNKVLIIAFPIFILLIAYNTFINNSTNARIVIYSLFIGILTLFNGLIYIKHGFHQVRKSSIFLAVVFLSLSVFLIFRALYTTINTSFDDLFVSTNMVNNFTFIMSISMGLLWTFGLIIAVNQKLNAELVSKGNQLQHIIQTIPDGVLISEISNSKIQNFNKGFAKITGYTSDEAVGKTILELKLWANISERENFFNELADKDFIQNKVIKARCKTGNEISVLFSATKFRADNTDYLLSIVKDITDLKEKELEIAAKNEELEVLNTEKDKFFSIIAHDLRSPFAALVSLTEVLSDKNYNFSNEQMQELASTINKTAISTEELLNDLLEWSGARRGVNKYKPAVSIFSEIMGNTLRNLENTAENKKINLINNIPALTSICADPYMFQTILRNLIINGIKFTPEGGSIELNLSNNENEEHIFSVSDNGIGMSPLIVESLFKIDANNKRAGTNGEPSSGLGLLLCKEFIEKHGGRIWAESTVGKGSTFFFTLS